MFTGLLLWAAIRSSALPPEGGSGDGSLSGVAGRVLAALSAELRKKAQFDFDDAEGKDWSNLPAGAYARKGVSLGEMDDAASSRPQNSLPSRDSPPFVSERPVRRRRQLRMDSSDSNRGQLYRDPAAGRVPRNRRIA